MLSLVSACAPVIQRAGLDLTAFEKIVWPGAPEKPRIQYLWSLHRLGNAADGEGAGFKMFFAGSEMEELQAMSALGRPQGIYADERRYYIADPGAVRVTVIDRVTLDVMHILYAGADRLEYPISVVSDNAGSIYVSDPELGKVIVYDSRGDFRFYFDGDIGRPAGLAMDNKRGLVYVADSLGHAVHIYGTDGKRKRSIGKRGEGDGEFNYPGHLVVDRDGTLYVSDFLNFRIQIFSPEGRFIAKFGKVGDSYDALDKPKGIGVDNEGHIYVVDGAKDMVKIFDRNGRLLLFFGETGHDYGQFYLPTGMYIENNVIYVADTINRRIQALRFLGGQ